VAEHVLARVRGIRAQPAVAEPPRNLGLFHQPTHRPCERAGIPGWHEQRALALHEQLSGGPSIPGDDRDAAGERLEDLVRNHASRLRGGPEHAERACGRAEPVRQLLVRDPPDPLDVRRTRREQALELATPGDPQLEIRSFPARGENGLDAV
jgi:hypothetical protein